jgi:dipeptidyl aminopeptidase/acylaminoacyl peptidase
MLFVMAIVAATPAVCSELGPGGESAPGGESTTKHPFSVHDMLAMDRISDPQICPEQEWVAFTVRVTDLEANKGRTDIWLARIDGTSSRRLTTDPAGDWNPRWTPRGQLYFLSTRSGSVQVWKIDPQGGEATQVTDLPLDVSNLEVVPQLESIIFSLEVYPTATIAATIERDQEQEAAVTTGMIYDELLFRHWDTWEDGKRSHLFIKKLQGDSAPRDLTPYLDADIPTRPWGGSEEFCVSPDGSTLIFTAKLVAGSEAAWSTDYDLYAVPTGRPEEPRCLTEANEAWDTEPVFSPDGNTVAYLAMARPGFEADRFRIVLLNLDTGERRILTEEWDRSPHGLVWSADGKTIYCTAANLGQRSIFSVEVKSGKVREIVKMGRNSSLQLAGKRLLFGQQSLQSPTELYTVKTNGKDLKRVTDLNGEKLGRCLIGEPEQFTFAGWNDETVWAYLVKPYDFSEEAAAAGQKWPVTFLIHGGPQGSFGNDFHYRWNPQAYIGAGFATVAVDFHGSVGYGQEFTDSISRHWGDRPYEDLVKGLDAALARYPWLDGDRVVAAGASFGGYMINWIHGQPFANRFKAFVCHDGNLDERMAYFDTEELWFPEWENGGPPWDGPEGAYEEFNPIEYVQNWHVPTLVIHGALDYRVVDTQGLSTFTALRRLGVPARLLYFPDENHWVLKPHNSVQWHEEVMGWLRRWVE